MSVSLYSASKNPFLSRSSSYSNSPHFTYARRNQTKRREEIKNSARQWRVFVVNLVIIIFALVSLVVFIRCIVNWNKMHHHLDPLSKLKKHKKHRSDFPSKKWCKEKGLTVARDALQGARRCTKDVWERTCAYPDDQYCRRHILQEFQKYYQGESLPSFFDALNNYLQQTQKDFSAENTGYIPAWEQ